MADTESPWAVLKLHPGMFRQKPVTKTIRKLREKSRSYIFERLETPRSGGILVWKVGRLYPEKSVPHPETVWDFRILKKLILGNLSALSGKGARGAILGFVFTPWKRKIAFLENLLYHYVEVADILVSHHYLLKRFYFTQVKETRTFTYVFLRAIGFSKYVCSGISDIVMNFLYFDNAYYFRYVDIMSETSREKLLANPGKEVLRLYNIYKQREMAAQNSQIRTGVYVKIYVITKILRLLLMHPKIKRAFREAVKIADIEKMKADEADRYYCLLISNYNYMGQPFKVRTIVYQQMHVMAGHTQLPPLLEVEA